MMLTETIAMTTTISVSATGCPHCGADGTVTFDALPDAGVVMAGCLGCGSIWEAIPNGEQYLVDGEVMPWREPCDNCAFRAGSAESRDRAEWRDLLERLRGGGQFFCHKGVPLKKDELVSYNRVAFDYPVDGAGEYARDKMRLCRGFLNAWMRWRGLVHTGHTPAISSTTGTAP